MNWSIDHKLLKDPYISGLKGSNQVATWIVYCFIIHFTKNTGGVDFYTTSFASDWHMKPNTIKKAIEGLLAAGYIRRTRLYQRKGNIPARYEATRYSPKVKKVYPKSQKGIAPRAKVNNYNNNYNTQDDDFNQSSLAKLSDQDYFKLIEQASKQRKKEE